MEYLTLSIIEPLTKATAIAAKVPWKKTNNNFGIVPSTSVP